MRTVIGAVLISAAISACLPAQAQSTDVEEAPTAAAAPVDIEAEAARLRAALRREVPSLMVDAPGAQQRWFVRAKAEIDASDFLIDRPQLLVVVDRNPHMQQLRIVLARTEE